MSSFSAGDLSGFAQVLHAQFADSSHDERLLANRFVHRLALLDVQHLSTESLAGAIRAIYARAKVRNSSEAIVETYSDASSTYLFVVTDDMSFLVDSVTMALANAGRGVRSILHPQLVIQRSADGALQQVVDLMVDDELPVGALPESWIIVQLQHAHESDAQLVAAIREILGDVRASNDDWESMMERTEAIVRGLREHAPQGVATEEVDEAIELLEWLLADHFTFLGFRSYETVDAGTASMMRSIEGSDLGILRAQIQNATHRPIDLPPTVRPEALERHLVIVNKTGARSTVHRSTYIDQITVTQFSADGRVTGEHRLLGIFTSEAFAASVREIPLIRRRVQTVMDALELVPDSHSARDMLQFLETYPREELFQTHAAQLVQIAMAAPQLRALRQTRLFVRHDDYGRFVSCIVYLPRDRYNTGVRRRLEILLRTAYHGTSTEYTALVTEALLARVHFVIQLPLGAGAPGVDVLSLEAKVADACESWEDGFAAEAHAVLGEDQAQHLIDAFATAFPEAYKEDFDGAEAVADALSLMSLKDGELGLRWLPDSTRPNCVQFKVNRIGDEIAVSRLMPLMQHMGMDVIAERPYGIERAGAPGWVLDFDVQFGQVDVPDQDTLPARASETFRAAWTGRCEDDRYNALVVLAGLTWREAAVLRAYGHYLKQLGASFGQGFIQSVLASNVGIARNLVKLFQVRLDPAFDGDRKAAEVELITEIKHALDAVQSLDQDRILRSFLAVICATLRTNAFIGDLRERQALSFKIDARSVPDMPLPKPKFEVWVCSPRVEGVHLRFGSVARGGLRWSDRSEDFRTEILGLVKAQEVKNAVIVPVGAKGGFVPARLPDPVTDRAGWLAEGQASYREYLSAVLDVTDNLVAGTVVPPSNVVRHDGDDPYFVVAADKGTATFSDLANSIARDYGFWLDDAFASGGSVGYDHKAMGITARGAWESVKRHFRELGVDTQSQEFTAVGIGDMSGDVFGNGMMLSPHMRLIAAFDHRDIFIDPNPSAAPSFDERCRLFALPRSSWADYNAELISAGGGVFSRSLKAIPLSPEARTALGIVDDRETFAPAEVIRYILRAQVDLLWNGGIGTYVKAKAQSHADVGDKANDAIRINGEDLRCKVVGEGGNLGFTQLGRIEASNSGVRLNSDAIDNSAGVDTSDHEVNIKILLQPLLANNSLDVQARVELLASMTDEVAAHVLADNYGQNVVLGNARMGSARLVNVHRRMIASLEADGLLDRAIEFLPTDRDLAAREAAGIGLSSPELCVLLAYSKISLIHALGDDGLASDPWYAIMLERYFPQKLVTEYASLLPQHPLRPQIINTVTANQIVAIGGISFVFRAMEETGASAIDVVKAATVAIEVFGLQAVWDSICSLDNKIASAAQDQLHLEMRRLFDRATRWILQSGEAIDVSGMIATLSPMVQHWLPQVPQLLRGGQLAGWAHLRDLHVAAGVPEDIAVSVVSLLDGFSLLDIAKLVSATGESAESLVPFYYIVADHYQVDENLTRISQLARMDRWDTLARLALRSDMFAVVARLVESICRSTDASQAPEQRIAVWEARNAAGIERAKVTLAEVNALEQPSLASMSVLLRVMRNLAAG